MPKSCENIWGVDPEGKINEKMVLDAIIECFKFAHQEVLDDMKNYHSFKTNSEFEEMKNLNVKMLIQKFIEEEGGDFYSPTKKDLIKLVERLKEYAKNFRNPKIIEKHEEEILILINKL